MCVNNLLRLIRIVGKSIFRRNIGSSLFVLCVVFMTISPIMLYGVSQSIMSQVYESKQDVYGAFTDIYYQEETKTSSGFRFSETKVNELIPGFNYESFGTINTVYKEEIGTKVLQLGYVDPEAISLGRISILEGRLPQAENEVSLTAGMMKTLSVSNLGDEVTIDGAQYILVGEIEDFGWLWPKGEKQLKNQEAPVNTFVTEEKAEEIYQRYGFLQRQILLARTSWASNATESNENFFFNQNGQVIAGEDTFNVPQAFIYILYASSIFIIFSVVALSRKRISERLHIYHLLGMVKSDQLFCIRFEYVFLSILALGIGTGAGYLGTYFSLIILGQSTGISYRVTMPQQIVMGTILLLLVAVIMVVYLQSQSIINSQESGTLGRRMKSGRNGVIRLALMELYENKKLVISYMLLIAMSLALLSYCAFYQQKFSKESKYKAHPSLLPLDYDFEIVTNSINGVPGDEDTVYLGDSYELDGTSDEVIEQIRNEKGVSNVLAFRENNKMDILLSADKMELYIDASDFYLDDSYMPDGGLTPEMRYLFGYKEDDLILDSVVLGYPEETLKELSLSIVEGELHLDKLASGEEVILMVPALSLEETDRFGVPAITMNYPDYQSEDAMNCSVFKVGDEITLSGLMSEKRINGAVNSEEAVANYERIDRTVRIGAIIRSRVGKFYLSTLENCFAVLTLNEAFVPLEIPAAYNRLRIYSDNTLDPMKMNEKISGYLSAQPYMMLDDLQNELVGYRRLNFVISVFLGTIMALVILVNAVSLSTQLLTKTRLNMKRYALLRINGLSIRRTIRIWQIQCSLLGAGGLVIGLPITLTVLKQSFQMELAGVVGYLSPWKWGMIILLLLVLVASSLIPSIIYFRKHKDNPLSQLT